MNVFLIQVSGNESTHEETEADEWWEEPIKEGIYMHYDWKTRSRRAGWEKIEEGDKVLLYCDSTVKPHPKQISHILTVKEVHLNDKAWIKVEAEKLDPGMPRDVVTKKLKSGELSEGMKNCGQQGFNMAEVEREDLDIVQGWSEKTTPTYKLEELIKESHLQDFLEKSPEKIEEGLEKVIVKLPEEAGEPDLVCKDKGGKNVVIELKEGMASYKALGQVLSYKNSLRKEVEEEVRSMIVARSFDEKIKTAAEESDVELIKWKPSFGFKKTQQ